MINVLGIETSCDETAASVVRSGAEILSNVVFSQVALHSPYGGVVPEIASRSHVENLPGIIERALSESGIDWSDLGMVAVTRGPGLAGCLLTGVSAAKALAQRLDIPLVGVNHLHAHIYSAFLGDGPLLFEKFCPFIVLLVSGGNTCIVRVDRPGAYFLLGRTLDDAAGEAFDKAANMLGLGYPGGPVIDRISGEGDPSMISFPEGRIDRNYCPDELDPELCFSFSGVKTSLLYYLKKNPVGVDGLNTAVSPRLPGAAGSQRLLYRGGKSTAGAVNPLNSSRLLYCPQKRPISATADIAAAFQEAIVSALLKKTWRAIEKTGIRNLAAVGGVSLNSALRNGLRKMAETRDLNLRLADKALCGDNAAMVAALAGAWNDGVVDDVSAMDIDPAVGV